MPFGGPLIRPSKAASGPWKPALDKIEVFQRFLVPLLYIYYHERVEVAQATIVALSRPIQGQSSEFGV
jgi:hypothetical protein